MCSSDLGVLLSTNKRDFQFNVSQCVEDVASGFFPTVCGTEDVLFNSTSNHATYYYWDFGVDSITSDTSTEENPTYSYPGPGNYDVTLIVNKGLTCADTSTMSIIVPQLNAEYDYQRVCIFDSVSFSDSSTYDTYSGNIISWWWDFNDGTTDSVQNPAHIFSDSLNSDKVNYNVSLIITTDKGCTDTIIYAIDFYPFPNVNATVNTGDYGWVSIGESVQLLSTGALGYVWTPADGLNSNVIYNPLATINGSNPYIVDGTSYDSIIYVVSGASPDGCLNNDTVVLRVAVPAVAIPNVFTPNNDGQNDVLYLLSVGVEELIEFKIFNRWGEVIFETQDKKEGWDGTFKSKPQEVGNYAYYYKVKTIGGDTREGHGDVALLR